MQLHLFSLCYLAAFIAYSSIGQMAYALYRQYHIESVMLVTGIFTFIGFGTTNAIVVHIMKKVNLKKSLLFGFAGFAIYEFTIQITIIFSEYQTPFFSSLPFLYIINSTAGFLAGFSNALVWTVNPSYIQLITSDMSMTSKMGLFWSIYMWGTIIGGLINIFVLGYVHKFIYLLVVLGFSVLGLFLTSIFVKPYQIQRSQNSEDNRSELKSIGKQLMNLVVITKNFPSIFIFSFVAGLFLSYYVIFINNVISLSLPSDIDEQTLNRDTGIVFMCQGIAAIFTGLAQRNKKLGEMNKLTSLRISLIMIEVNLIALVLGNNLLTHQDGMFWVSIVIIMSWQIAQIHIKTTMDAYIRQIHAGKVQYYSMNIFFYSLGSIAAFFILMIDDSNISLLVLGCVGILLSILWFGRDSLMARDSPLLGDKKEELEQDQLTGKLIINQVIKSDSSP